MKKRNLSNGSLSTGWRVYWVGIVVVAVCWGATAIAAPTKGLTVADLKVGLDTLWVLLAGFLAFFANAGFSLFRTGSSRQKNAVNMLMQSLMGFALVTIAYWAIGFGIMFAEGNPVLGIQGWFMGGADNSPVTGSAYKGVFKALNWAGVPLTAKFLFQLMFAGTATTIVMGAIAERTKFIAFLLFSLIFAAVLYPIPGHWVWGGGWLARLPRAGFWDFAGGTVVHSVGGWAALMGTMLMGPRFGRYSSRRSRGRAKPMPGHNLSMATLGCFVIWLGWFGLHAGATMKADPTRIVHIVMATNTAAVFGGVAAMIVTWRSLGKPNLWMLINGILAGLVGISASCAWVSIPAAAAIGAIAGVLCVLFISLLDHFHIDDPASAVSIHLVGGVWSTLSVGLLAVGPNAIKGPLYSAGPARGFFVGGELTQLLPQVIGIFSVGLFAIVSSTIVWALIQAITGLRVFEEAEIQGLDWSEHEMEAYSGLAKEENETTKPLDIGNY